MLIWRIIRSDKINCNSKMTGIDSIRREYSFSGLSRENADRNPFRQFELWLDDALGSNEKDPTAMAFITIDREGFPQSRIVLLKYVNEKGFIFFTNYDSDKGKAVSQNGKTGLHFFWPALERQIRITGTAERTERSLSGNYFHSRPRESQISVWASKQSQEVVSREYLEQRFEEYSNRFAGKPVPVPPFWGGYLVIPKKMEFWQGRASRLHDRIVYEKEGEEWRIARLAP